MTIANTKNLQNSILGYLRERPQQKFTSTDLAAFFQASKMTVASRLRDLVNAGRVEMSGTSRKGFRYWFEADPEEKPVERPSWARKLWQMPSMMLERVQEARSQREAFPSKHV